MGKKIISKRKQDTINNGKYVKGKQECPLCHKNLKLLEDHYCNCKRGIVNIGNSCYINAVFQTMAELNIFSCLPEKSQLGALLDELCIGSDEALTPDLALFEIKDLWTHNNLQEDAYDFFLTILPLFESSKFTFEYLSQRICEVCHLTCEAVVREDCSIHMAVDGRSLQEHLDGTVEPIDELCGKCGNYMMRLLNIMKAPEILTVRIVRFQMNQKTGKTSKIWNKVELPEKVTIGNKEYMLEVVILHKSKALNHGHYIVYLHKKKIIIDDAKVFYNKALRLDYSYFYIAFYI